MTMLSLVCNLQGSEEAMYVYMATPLGPALAQITEQHLLKGRAVSSLLLLLRYCFSFKATCTFVGAMRWRSDGQILL